MPHIFLSYRHESPEHSARVLAFAKDLRLAQLEVVLDQLANEEQFNRGGPPEGWPAWSQRQAGQGRVLIVASPGWCAAYEGTAPPGKLLGCAAEGVVIRQRLYEAGAANLDIRVVLMDSSAEPHVPLALRAFHQFLLPDAIHDVVRWLGGSAPPPPPSPTGNPIPPPHRSHLGPQFLPVLTALNELVDDYLAERPELFRGIHKGWWKSLPAPRDAMSAASSDLRALDEKQLLADGTVPLRIFLTNVIAFAEVRGANVTVFQAALAAL